MIPSNIFNGIVGISALTLVLTGCASPYIRNADMLPGPETFTFAGDLPKDFGITAQANYHAVEPKNCQVFDISLQRKVTRNFGRDWIASISNQQQRFSFAIPLTYKSGLCEMTFSGMDLEIDAKFGELDWQTSYGKGGLILKDKLMADQPAFNTDEKLTINSTCEWLFMISNMYLQLDKSLKCRGAGAYLQRDQLADKTVRLTVALNPEERPSQGGTWVKFPTGWKPCLGRGPDDKFGFCYNSPGIFKEFKMNGNTCTIYPSCDESTGVQP